MLRWFVADLRTGRQILDLPVLFGGWERFLGAPEALNATLDMRDPDTIQLRPRIAAAPGRSILACAAGDVILAAGPIWAHSYKRDPKTLKLAAAGVWSYFDHRYVLPIAAASLPVNEFVIPDGTSAGKTKPNPAVGTYLSALEYGTIAKRWVQQAQAWTGGSVPIVFEDDRVGTRQRNFEGADFKNLGTVLRQLSQIEGGPDIRFFPRLTADRLGIEFVLQTGTDASPLLAGGPHLWDLTAPDSGISGFEVNVDASGMAGTAWATAGRSADTVLVARSIDPTLSASGYPLLETLDSSHTTVSEQATLNAYAAEATLAGRTPTEMWDFDVEATRQPFLGSFWEGDWCDVTVAGYEDGLYTPPSYTDWVEQRRNYATNTCRGVVNAHVTTVRGTASPGADHVRLTINDATAAVDAQRIEATGTAMLVMPAVQGDVFTLSAEGRSDTSATMTVQIQFRDSSGLLVGSGSNGAQTTVNASTFTPLAPVTATAPAGTARVYWRVGLHTGARSIGQTMDARNVLLEKVGTAGGFFDGSTADVPPLERYEWTGAADASASVLETRELISLERSLPGGDPYLYEKQESHRRITYLAGDQDGLVVAVRTMERV